MDNVVGDHASFSVGHSTNTMAGIQNDESVLDWCGDLGIGMLAIVENDGSEGSEGTGGRDGKASRRGRERPSWL